MTDFPDYQEPQANATALAGTNLTGTGLAKELGGNLATHTALLGGTQAGALIANPGLTVAQETAALIATGLSTGVAGGTPLLHGAKQVYSVIGQVVAAAGSFSTGAILIAKPGYLIRINAQMSGVNAVTPFMECDLTWSVPPNTGQVTSEEIWFVNCGSTGAVNTRGKGPTKGGQLNITFTNGDITDSVTLTVQVWETTQHISRDDWRNPGGVPSAAATGAKGDNLANIVASDSFSVAANSTAFRNLPLYAGEVTVTFNQNVAANSTVVIIPFGDFTLANQSPVAQFDWTSTTRTFTGIALPRCPCQVQAINAGGTPINFIWTVIAKELTS